MNKRSTAIIGSGISGLSAAWHLSKDHKIFLLEKGSRLGGHTHTHTLHFAQKDLVVDSGFIVFNEINYPNFTDWLGRLNVKRAKSEMSFSVSRGTGDFEWSGKNLFSVFGQKKNIISPSFIKMLLEIVKFNKLSKKLLEKREVREDENKLGAFLDKNNFSDFFFLNYLGPMAGAIWSTPESKITDYPTKSILQFFNNHGLLSINNHHQWFHLVGGSSSYIDQLFNHREFKEKEVEVLKNHYVKHVETKQHQTKGKKVYLQIENLEKKEEFTLVVDDVIFACHADETLSCVKNKWAESSILQKIQFQKNYGFLHNDKRLMPKRNSVWSSWNYIENEHDSLSRDISVTYWMNKLQNLDTRENLFVSLNPFLEPRDSGVKKKLVYEHPIFDKDMMWAREKLQKFQGTNNIWYCGAWTGNGFHEDGFVSGKKVAEKIDCRTC